MVPAHPPMAPVSPDSQKHQPVLKPDLLNAARGCLAMTLLLALFSEARTSSHTPCPHGCLTEPLPGFAAEDGLSPAGRSGAQPAQSLTWQEVRGRAPASWPVARVTFQGQEVAATAVWSLPLPGPRARRPVGGDSVPASL